MEWNREISDELARAALKTLFECDFVWGCSILKVRMPLENFFDEVGKSQDLSLSAAKQSMVLLKIKTISFHSRRIRKSL